MFYVMWMILERRISRADRGVVKGADMVADREGGRGADRQADREGTGMTWKQDDLRMFNWTWMILKGGLTPELYTIRLG
jgi:hypothetical protein